MTTRPHSYRRALKIQRDHDNTLARLGWFAMGVASSLAGVLCAFGVAFGPDRNQMPFAVGAAFAVYGVSRCVAFYRETR